MFRRAGIARPSADVQSSFVTNADGVFVVSGGVCTYLVKSTPRMNYPVAGDVVVITDVGKATGTMVTTAVVHGVTLRGAGGTTMYHNQVDATVVLVLRTGQNGVAHNTPQACKPKAVAMAVNTVMVIFKIVLHTELGVSLFIVSLVFS